MPMLWEWYQKKDTHCLLGVLSWSPLFSAHENCEAGCGFCVISNLQRFSFPWAWASPRSHRNSAHPEQLWTRHFTIYHPVQFCHSAASLCQDLVLKHSTNTSPACILSPAFPGLQNSRSFLCLLFPRVINPHLSGFSCMEAILHLWSCPLPLLSFPGSTTCFKMQESKLCAVSRTDENHIQK